MLLLVLVDSSSSPGVAVAVCFWVSLPLSPLLLVAPFPLPSDHDVEENECLPFSTSGHCGVGIEEELHLTDFEKLLSLSSFNSCCHTI